MHIHVAIFVVFQRTFFDKLLHEINRPQLSEKAGIEADFVEAIDNIDGFSGRAVDGRIRAPREWLVAPLR